MSRITAPDGYQIVTTDSKLEISQNNTVTVDVKKLGRTIKVVYRLAKTNRIVTTGKIVVDKKATSIKASRSSGTSRIQNGNNRFLLCQN